MGVVADVRQTALTDPPAPELYVPADQVSSDLWTVFMTIPISFVVRSDVQPARLVPAIKAAVHEVIRGPVARLREAGELLQNATARQRFNMSLLTLFGLLALVLATVGVYGVVA